MIEPARRRYSGLNASTRSPSLKNEYISVLKPCPEPRSERPASEQPRNRPHHRPCPALERRPAPDATFAKRTSASRPATPSSSSSSVICRSSKRFPPDPWFPRYWSDHGSDRDSTSFHISSVGRGPNRRCLPYP